jgi:hypothetical protein
LLFAPSFEPILFSPNSICCWWVTELLWYKEPNIRRYRERYYFNKRDSLTCMVKICKDKSTKYNNLKWRCHDCFTLHLLSKINALQHVCLCCL